MHYRFVSYHPQEFQLHMRFLLTLNAEKAQDNSVTKN